MAKGSDNSKAIKLQEASLAESKRQAKVMEAGLKAQLAAAAAMEMPKFQGAAAAPTQSSSDVEQAGIDMRVKQMRKSGYNSTIFAGAKAA